MDYRTQKQGLVKKITTGATALALSACSTLPGNIPNPYHEIFRNNEAKNEAPIGDTIAIDYSTVDGANDFVVINDRAYQKDDKFLPAELYDDPIQVEQSGRTRLPTINASYVELESGKIILRYDARTVAPELKASIEPYLKGIEIKEQGNHLMMTGPKVAFGNFKDLSTIINQYDVTPEQIRVRMRIVEYFNDNTYDRESALNWVKDGIEALNINLPSNPDPTVSLTTGISINPFAQRNQEGKTDVYTSAIKFLDSHGKTNTLADLDMLVSNGNPALFSNQSEIPYPEVLVVGNSVLETLKYKPTGVIISVTPFANEEGFINLKVTQAESGEQTGFAGTLQRPIFRTAKLESEFIVRDGLTYFAATSLFTRYRSVDRGIPGLNKIPIIKDATTSRSIENNQSQLLYFVEARRIPRNNLTGTQKE
ncbi:hypothetical protein COU53_04165 [Candidatus Pacearchaeota archaeon CG10_big_fil_rev_8_21_14_0_10_30_48]|nr:MAG: hypothetical protein COU53_04165 [Candidatus Pacearchaeota archaeon CG10_big_fil_rev_8_21_14_0_10_30_48]